ncbi:MAG TPA: N-methyl-L-tryptophan oxidase [Polyangiaceae bacterium]|nr:N-methyl-L-tryptophan oxidase [Polyangiaceae bacterium]
MFDVIVVGLGAMGSAAAMHMARRGARVLGLDRFGPAHDEGSSHGESRLIRKAYFESPAYVPLLERSYALWDALAADTGATLLHRTGLVLFGKRAAAASAVARDHGVVVERLSPAEARARFPGLRVDDELEPIFEPGAGWLEVERCVSAHLDAARTASADLRFDDPALAWRVHPSSGHVEVETARERHRAGRLVLAAGAWAPSLLAHLGLPLQPHRVLQMWFEATPAHEAPCFGFDLPGAFFYGFPRAGGRVKVADHMARQPIARPEDVRREIDAEDTRRVEAFVRDRLPALRTPPVLARTCLYTMTPDEHFVIDVHPRHPQVTFAAGFSGHGFKFSPVVGEMLADLALEGRARADADFLRHERFAARA